MLSIFPTFIIVCFVYFRIKFVDIILGFVVSMKIIDSKKLSNEKRFKIKNEISKIVSNTGYRPGLATILVGDDYASKIYIKLKIKACDEVGIKSFNYNVSSIDIYKFDLIKLIKNLNLNPNIHGILLQLPLPKKIKTEYYISNINPLKDVDCIHPFNIGTMYMLKKWDEIIKKNIIIPCTPLGIINLLHNNNVKISEKIVVVIGRSILVGKPIASLLLANDATVIMTHSKTYNLEKICKRADIIIVSVGRAKFLNKNFIKNKTIIIDVGMNNINDKVCGDVDIDSIKNMDVKITSVPGGIGPMTITSLLENTLKIFKNQIFFKK
jgi:methylenetetrahydrofolate dehydrogenase (NADP+)/methenyltetrahydrofolate cyclohydrolase